MSDVEAASGQFSLIGNGLAPSGDATATILRRCDSGLATRHARFLSRKNLSTQQPGRYDAPVVGIGISQSLRPADVRGGRALAYVSSRADRAALGDSPVCSAGASPR